MKEYLLKVTGESAGKRLDLFLMENLQTLGSGLSRTAVQKMILEGKVSITGLEEVKPHHKIKENDEVKVIVEDKAASEIKAEDIQLDVVYEDEKVVNEGKFVTKDLNPESTCGTVEMGDAIVAAMA